MTATKHNHVRKEFPAATADPSLRNPVLPGTAVRDTARLDTHRSDGVHYNRIEDGIAVENEILWCGVVRKRFPQLLDSPRRCRVERGIEVQNTSSAVLYHEEYVKYFKRDRRNGEEIHVRFYGLPRKRIGTMFFPPKNIRLVFILVSFAVFQPSYADELDDAQAAHNKGDYTTSFRESKKLAERGNADAQGLLGLMYYGGDGVERDTAQAVNWLQKGAENGSATTQYLLGFLYLGGEGVEQDIAQAYVWFYLSASQGNKAAEEFRDVAANSMTPAQIAEAQTLAKEWAVKYNKE